LDIVGAILINKMNLTKEQFDRMVMKDGRVLILVDEFETSKIGSIHINPVGDETRSSFAARSGLVIKIPVNTDILQMGYDFKSEMELEVGDKVWWSANATGNLLLLKENARFEVEDKEYIIIPYPEIYLAKRGDKMIALNDRCIAVKTEAVKSSIIDLSVSSLSEPPPDRFKVVYVPSFHGKYASGRQIIRCEIGDTVKIDSNGGVAGKLEDDHRSELDEFYYFRSADILAKQTKDEEEN
jgi:hypothetical protein